MKKMMKNTVMILMVLVTMVSLAGCGKKEDGKLHVGIIQMMENGAFTDMREGFIKELRDQGYSEDKLEITYKNAQGDLTSLNTLVQELIDAKVDLIAAIATPSAQAAVNMESDIPVIFISVSNPTAAGIITEMEHPDKNATGTSNAIPVGDIFALSDLLTPGCTTYGIIYNTGETNSVSTVASAKEYLDANGLSYVEKVVTNSSEVQQAAQSLVGLVDAIFIPNDTVLQAAMPVVTEIARDAKIPVYGSSAVMVQSGAFATIAISDTKIGALSADMAVSYFTGTKIEDIPAIVVPADDTVINKTTADALGITLSEDVTSSAIFVEDAAN